MYFDYLGVRLNGDNAAGKAIVLERKSTDTRQNYVLHFENSALSIFAGADEVIQ